MIFAAPLWLFALPVIGLLALLQARGRTTAAAGRWPLIPRLWASVDGLRAAGPSLRLPRHIALWAGLTLCVVALARPRWGLSEGRVFGHAREVLIAIDLSRSMLAKDVAPSRLERAKVLVRVLLDSLTGERVGLVVFAGTAFLQSPLSPDYEVLREFLPSLDPAYLPQGGTDYDDLLRVGLDAFGKESEADRFFIVLSDGESHTDSWHRHLEEFKKRNIRAITLGLGTAKGSLIPTPDGSFVKDERGAAVLSRLDDATLRELAAATGGDYQDASGWVDIAALIEGTIAKGARGAFQEQLRRRYTERFQWFLAPGILLLLASLWREFPAVPRVRFVRRAREEDVEPPLGPVPSAQKKSCAASGAAVLLAAALGVFPRPGSAQQPAAPPQPAANAAQEPPAAPPAAERLKELLQQIPGKPSPPATDFADIARATIDTAIDPTALEDTPVRRDVLLDGVDAVNAGERIDSRAAPWKALREQLLYFLNPPQQPQQQPQRQDEKKQQQEQGSGSRQNADSKNQPSQSSQQDQQQQNQEGQEPQDRSESEARNKPAQGQSLAGLTNRAPQQAREPKESPDTQRIGGKPTQTRQEARDNPELAEALRRYERARNLDSPARLAKILDQIEGKAPEPSEKGKDW